MDPQALIFQAAKFHSPHLIRQCQRDCWSACAFAGLKEQVRDPLPLVLRASNAPRRFTRSEVLR